MKSFPWTLPKETLAMAQYRRSNRSKEVFNQPPKKLSARYDPKADGWFFSRKERRELFKVSVREVFNRTTGEFSTLTVDQIITNPTRLIDFSSTVYIDLLIHVAGDPVAFAKIKEVPTMDAIDPITGVSFCNHVAKRLLRLRKEKQLRARKKQTSTYRRIKDVSRNSTEIRKVS